MFFVKYNDPIYVKLEKLDIMIRLASQANIAQVLGELKEYATEVDVDFVRKAVRAIGRCAIKVRLDIGPLVQANRQVVVQWPNCEANCGYILMNQLTRQVVGWAH